MTPLEEEVVRIARGYAGTRWHHQGRLPGVGLDCVGVLACAARAAGHPLVDCPNYGPNPNPRQLLEHLAINLEPWAGPARAGLVAVFYWRTSHRGNRLPQHLGILVPRAGAPGGLGLLHAPRDVGRVVEVDFDADWTERVDSFWTFREAA